MRALADSLGLDELVVNTWAHDPAVRRRSYALLAREFGWRRRLMTAIDFELRGDYITLDALLKATGLAESGGRAKAMVAAGLVQVDGQQELRKTCKLRAGQVVALAGARIRARRHGARRLRAIPAEDLQRAGVFPGHASAGTSGAATIQSCRRCGNAPQLVIGPEPHIGL